MQMFQNIGRSMQAGDVLKIRCGLCAHQTAWPRAVAIERLGERARPAEVRRVLKCGACGSGAKVQVWI
jgi:hypothetical protein